MSAAASTASRPTATFAALLWPPADAGLAGAARAIALVLLGVGLLTLSAKLQVPGPVPMTMQTLAVLALGAGLGARLALATVAVYVAEGLLGLPVFANTPPLVPGPAYLLGPTGGFLLGFALAAVLVGAAAERGWMRRSALFALALAAADALLLLCGWLWLALFARLATGGQGLGLARAFELGVQPFLLGEAIKLAIAAIALPLLCRAATARARR